MDAPSAMDIAGGAPLAIICGGGVMPVAVADAVIARGRAVLLFPIRGWADPERVEKYPHVWLAVAQVDKFLKQAKAAGCRDVVFIGTAVRPPFSALRVDWGMLKLLPRVWRMYRGGDDHLLSGVVRVFEDHGFRILGAHEVAPEILVPRGALGSRTPSDQDRADIARALEVIHAIGPFDVGQGVIVARNHVLAVEAAGGTDNMLGHIAELRQKGRIPSPSGTGVLVKAPKPGQDRRIDLPTIGPRTVDEVARAGLAGIAIAAGETIVAEPEAVAKAADIAGVFVVGIDGTAP